MPIGCGAGPRGRQLPAGLDVDPDLRWEIVRRLARGRARPRADRGGPGPRSEQRRPRPGRPGPRGARHRGGQGGGLGAADAAVRPSARTSCTPPARASSIPVQTELTAPYVPRFFAEIGATAAFRSGWSLGEVAATAYPWSATSAETLAARRAGAEPPTLAAPDPPGPRRRHRPAPPRRRSRTFTLQRCRVQPRLDPWPRPRSSTWRRICSISSNSAWPQISGGATWTTGSPRSSARQ